MSRYIVVATSLRSGETYYGREEYGFKLWTNIRKDATRFDFKTALKISQYLNEHYLVEVVEV